MKFMNHLLKVGSIVSLVAGLAACGGTNATTAVSSGTITVVADDYRFTPNQISVEAGSTLTVVLENRGAVDHNIAFQLPGGDVRLPSNVPPGRTGQLNLTAPMAQGSYPFICPIDNHRGLGMTGTLVVGPAASTPSGGGGGGGGGGY